MYIEQYKLILTDSELNKKVIEERVCRGLEGFIPEWLLS